MKEEGFSLDPTEVRVDFFKESGKWYTTEVLKFDQYDGYILDVFERCLKEQFPGRYKEMAAVCLHPYHENSHPLMIMHKG